MLFILESIVFCNYMSLLLQNIFKVLVSLSMKTETRGDFSFIFSIYFNFKTIFTKNGFKFQNNDIFKTAY